MTQHLVTIERFISMNQVHYYIVGHMTKKKDCIGFMHGKEILWEFPIRLEVDEHDNIFKLDPFAFRGESKEERKRYKYYLKAKHIIERMNEEFNKYMEDPEGYGDDEEIDFTG